MNTVTTKVDPGSEPVRGAPNQQTALERHLARERTEVLLDEALGETFPASDPIAITSRKHGST
ncbi:MAG: hypothetical protein ABI132_01625 [Rhodanobacteraceae bacterium]